MAQRTDESRSHNSNIGIVFTIALEIKRVHVLARMLGYSIKNNYRKRLVRHLVA